MKARPCLTLDNAPSQAYTITAFDPPLLSTVSSFPVEPPPLDPAHSLKVPFSLHVEQGNKQGHQIERHATPISMRRAGLRHTMGGVPNTMARSPPVSRISTVSAAMSTVPSAGLLSGQSLEAVRSLFSLRSRIDHCYHNYIGFDMIALHIANVGTEKRTCPVVYFLAAYLDNYCIHIFS